MGQYGDEACKHVSSRNDGRQTIATTSYRRLGGAQPGNRFVSFVRVYARSGSEVGIGEN